MTKIDVSGSLLLYAIIGLSGVLLDFCVFVTCFNVLGWHAQLANALGTTAGISNNFALNTLFNFRTRDRVLLRFTRFYLVGLVGIAMTSVLLHVFADVVGMNPNVVKASSLPLVLIVQYTLNKRWSFA